MSKHRLSSHLTRHEAALANDAMTHARVTGSTGCTYSRDEVRPMRSMPVSVTVERIKPREGAARTGGGLFRVPLVVCDGEHYHGDTVLVAVPRVIHRHDGSGRTDVMEVA